MSSRKSLIFICIAGVAWVLASVVAQHAGYSLIVCPSRLFYDLPCAGCGGTRAFLLLIKGHPIDAFLMNPNVYLVVPVIVAGLALLFYDYFRHTDKFNVWYKRFKQAGNRPSVYVPVLLFEAVVLAYNIWRYRQGLL